jgi:hypothetical protein
MRHAAPEGAGITAATVGQLAFSGDFATDEDSLEPACAFAVDIPFEHALALRMAVLAAARPDDITCRSWRQGCDAAVGLAEESGKLDCLRRRGDEQTGQQYAGQAGERHDWSSKWWS